MRRLIRSIAAVTITLWAGASAAGEGGSADAPAPAVPPPPAATAPNPQPAPQAAPPSKGSGTPATVLDTDDYESLLGKSVRAANGDDLGRIIDLIIDRDGRPRAAIIDFGGFLGVGSRKIAVDWRVLKFSTDGKVGRLTLTLNRNQVRVSPEYKPGEPIVVLGSSSPGLPPDADQAAPAADRSQPAPADKPSDARPPEKTPER